MKTLILLSFVLMLSGCAHAGHIFSGAGQGLSGASQRRPSQSQMIPDGSGGYYNQNHTEHCYKDEASGYLYCN